MGDAATVAVHVGEPDGRRHALAAAVGLSLMRAAVVPRLRRREWIDRLPAPSADEDAMLEMTAAPRAPTSRLGCQIALAAELDGLTVVLPATQC